MFKCETVRHSDKEQSPMMSSWNITPVRENHKKEQPPKSDSRRINLKYGIKDQDTKEGYNDPGNSLILLVCRLNSATSIL